jgi:uncharacterized protein YjdB
MFRRSFKYIIIAIAVFLVFHYLVENSSIFYRKWRTMPFALHLNRNDIVLAKGEEFHLFVYGLNKRVSFASTNFRVAGVNFNGRVMAYQTGKAFIIAKVDKKELKCRVRVIDLNKDKLTLVVGETYHLKLNGIVALHSFKSSNSGIASVSLFGKVKANAPGNTIISVKVKDKELKCKVQVVKKE